MSRSSWSWSFFYEKPVHLLITDTSYILEEAKRVNQAALEEIFGRRSAQVGPSSLLQRVPRGAHPFVTGSLTGHRTDSSAHGSRSHVVWPSARSSRLPGPTSTESWSPARSSPTPAPSLSGWPPDPCRLHSLKRHRCHSLLCHVMSWVLFSGFRFIFTQ